MAARKGLDRKRDSFIRNIATHYKNSFGLRLLTWSVVIASALALAHLGLSDEVKIPSKAALALAFGIGGCASFGATIHTLTLFLLFNRLHWLYVSVAFAALGSGAIIQAMADMKQPVPASHEWFTTAGWLLSSLMFLTAAYSSGSWRPHTRLLGKVRFIISLSLVLGIPLIAVPYLTWSNDIPQLSMSVQQARANYLWDTCLVLVSVALLILSIDGYRRKVSSDNNQMATLLAYFLIPSTFALLSKLISEARFDDWWLMSQALLSLAWLVLVGRFAIAAGYANKVVNDRLAELEAVRQVSWSLVGAGNVSELLDMFAKVFRDKLDAKIVFIYLSAENNNLTLAAACSPDDYEAPLGTNYPMISTSHRPGFHSGHTARAFASGEIQVVKDVFVDVEFVPWRIVATDDGGAASIPLSSRDGTIGVLNLYFDDFRLLTPERLKLLTTIAASATPAIETAIRRDDAQAAFSKMEPAREVA